LDRPRTYIGEACVEVFLVISLFDLRNVLTKYGTFPRNTLYIYVYALYGDVPESRSERVPCRDCEGLQSKTSATAQKKLVIWTRTDIDVSIKDWPS
jgi:hypothetical protein